VACGTVASVVLIAKLSTGAGHRGSQLEAPNVSACTGLPPLGSERLGGLGGLAIRCRLHVDRK